MKRYIFNSLIAFFGGLAGFSGLFLLYWLVKANLWACLLPLFGYLLFISLIEEGTKFLLIKKWKIGKYPYGLLLGLGWGATENLFNYINYGNLLYAPLGLHIITAGIISYFIKKNKPLLGLLIAVIVHTGFNLFLVYMT